MRAHTAAVLALLRAAGLTVYPPVTGGTAVVPQDATLPYVVVYAHRSYGEPEAVDGATTRLMVRLTCHSVGATDESAQAMSDRVAAALLDVRPTVTGRSCWPIRHESSQPPRVDEDTGAAVWDVIDTYRLESLPA